MAARRSIPVILAAAVLAAMAVTLAVEARCLGAAAEKRYASLDGEVIPRARRWADPDAAPIPTCRLRRAACPEEDEATVPRLIRVHRHLKDDAEHKKEADGKKTAETKKTTPKTEAVDLESAKPHVAKKASEDTAAEIKPVAMKPFLITPAIIKPMQPKPTESSSEIKDASSGSSEACEDLKVKIEEGPPDLHVPKDGSGVSYDMSFGEFIARPDAGPKISSSLVLDKLMRSSLLSEPGDYIMDGDVQASLATEEASHEEKENKKPVPEAEVHDKKDRVKKGSTEVPEKKASEAKPTKDKKETPKKTE